MSNKQPLSLFGFVVRLAFAVSLVVISFTISRCLYKQSQYRGQTGPSINVSAPSPQPRTPMANFGRKDYNKRVNVSKIEKRRDEPMLLIRASDPFFATICEILAQKHEAIGSHWKVVDALRLHGERAIAWQVEVLEKRTTAATVDPADLPDQESTFLKNLREHRPDLFLEDGTPNWDTRSIGAAQEPRKDGTN